MTTPEPHASLAATAPNIDQSPASSGQVSSTTASHASVERLCRSSYYADMGDDDFVARLVAKMLENPLVTEVTIS